jgi:hypothetical protein
MIHVPTVHEGVCNPLRELVGDYRLEVVGSGESGNVLDAIDDEFNWKRVPAT